MDFLEVTELPGDEVSWEQVERICHRYYWAGKYCAGKDVLEVACGTGQGLGYLNKIARSVIAGDYSGSILKIALDYYGDRIKLIQFDAQDMPFDNDSMDVVIIFEAIYYLPSAERFINQCRRVLRNNGILLIATANKDLYDFNPSMYSHRYYGVVELNELLMKYGFKADFFGNTPVDKLPWRQRILRPVKKLAVILDMIPKTTNEKKYLKKIVFGDLTKMPHEIDEGLMPYVEPEKIISTEPDRKFKVIYCAATLSED